MKEKLFSASLSLYVNEPLLSLFIRRWSEPGPVHSLQLSRLVPHGHLPGSCWTVPAGHWSHLSRKYSIVQFPQLKGIDRISGGCGIYPDGGAKSIDGGANLLCGPVFLM